MPLLHHTKNGPYGLARVLKRVARSQSLVHDRSRLGATVRVKKLGRQRSLKHVVSTRPDNEEKQMKTINLDEKLNQFSSHWNPHVIADYNDNDVMVVRFIGEYPFHKHETTDDFFYVLEGEMEMDIEGELPRTVKAGELFIVPKGVVHRPRAKNEVKVLLIEPKGEPNSGDSDREPAPKPHI